MNNKKVQKVRIINFKYMYKKSEREIPLISRVRKTKYNRTLDHLMEKKGSFQRPPYLNLRKIMLLK